MQRLADAGQRTGYMALVVAIGAFVWALVAHFPAAATTLLVAGMVVCTITLAPAIVLGYAVKAAEREDRASASELGLEGARRRRLRGEQDREQR
jgi:hypothetical protein